MKILLVQRAKNQDVSHLVRLGKVIHYQAIANGGNVVTHWPSKKQIDNSDYWLSDGQAEIKRNEALVRIWKLVIAHAAHSLSDWADWHEDDILLAAKELTQIDSASFDAKFKLLFGREVTALPTSFSDDASRLTLLKFAIEAWAELRHSSFHFKGKASFLKSLQKDSQPMPDGVAALWEKDQKDQQKRLQKTLEGAHCLDYLRQEQLQALFSAVEKSCTQSHSHATPQSRAHTGEKC